MLSRRQFLTRSLKGASLLTLSSVVPQFIAKTALAAEPGKDSILVVVELNGGNDGLNTVIPYADDLYPKFRDTLRQTKDQIVKVDDHIGLNSGMRSFDRLLQRGELAVVQGVGYPNPERSHFESMDTWQSADPTRKINTGWLGRSVNELHSTTGGIPIMHVGPNRLPLALTGGAGGAISINNQVPYRLEMGGGAPDRQKARRKLLEDLAQPGDDTASLADFVYRREVQTLTTLDRLQEVLKGTNTGQFPGFGPDGRPYGANALPQKLQLIAQLIQKGFGTRIFYVMRDGFDTHSDQVQQHKNLLAEVADGVTTFFETLRQSGHDKQVRLMTFSEFGRRVQENASKGTDHGAASCLFVAGPGVKGGAVGAHPRLDDLDAGDLKFHTDFRRVYATLLDHWLGCDSQSVLSGKFEPIDAIKG
ncbi:MAG TPA: DUF1501 domain-containing protein [Gemmataceae bacterium]|nr:DUF1501 domain-containing protein [Gemmataceae bacterium]